jgi:hypothetical protein
MVMLQETLSSLTQETVPKFQGENFYKNKAIVDEIKKLAAKSHVQLHRSRWLGSLLKHDCYSWNNEAWASRGELGISEGHAYWRGEGGNEEDH